MGGNTLVATEQDADPLSGTFLGQDIVNLAGSIKGGSWLSASLMGVATAVDLAATVSDPFGSLLAAGFGWLEDHLEPLKGWLNDLTGDPQAVEAYAKTWENVAERMTETAQDLLAKSRSDLATATGDAIKAYQEHASSMSEAMNGIKEAAEGTASGLEKAAEIIDLVHGIVRDVIAQICGAIVSWAAELVFSFGLATPLVIEQATTRVSDAVAKISSKVTGLVESCHALEELLRKLDSAVTELRSALDKIHPGAARGEHEAPIGSPRGGHTPEPGRHVKKETPAEVAKRVAAEKGKDVVRGGGEDVVTESSTYDGNQAQHAHDYLQNRLGPYANSPI